MHADDPGFFFGCEINSSSIIGMRKVIMMMDLSDFLDFNLDVSRLQRWEQRRVKPFGTKLFMSPQYTALRPLWRKQTRHRRSKFSFISDNTVIQS